MNAAVLIPALLALPLLSALAVPLGSTGAVPLALAAGLALAVAGRPTAGALLAALLAAEPLVEVLKRGLFLLGGDDRAAYYAVQLLPTALLALALVPVLPRLTRLPPPAAWLLALVGWVTACAALAPAGTPWFTRLGSLHQEILPALAFLPALLVTAAERPWIARVAALVCLVTVLYGLWQFLAGYTGLDLAWAVGAAERSIQAGKVHAWLVGDSWERRVFSLFPDPFTWGQALAGGLMLVLLGRLGLGWRALAWAAVLTGLVLTQSRTPWATLLVTGLAWAMLGWQPLRRPGVVMAALLLGFPLTLWLGGALYDGFFTGLPASDDPFLRRWLTVGTIEARLNAWTNLRDVLSTHPLTGLGAGTDPRYGAAVALSPAMLAAHDAHNVLVSLALFGGLPAVVLFCGFQWSWLRLVWRDGGGPDARLATAFLLGSQAAGYLNAGIFLTWQYFLVLGLVAGESVARWRAAVVASPPVVDGTARRVSP